MLIGWYCQKCRANVPLDHYETCQAVHPDYAAAVLADSRKDRSDGIHVTSALGCPRKSAIEQSAEIYIDPLSYNAMLGGTAWHGLMEAASMRPDLCEVDVAGTIGGVPLVGRVDRLHPPATISDWKTTSEWAEKWLKQDGAKREHIAQLSLYAELVEQTLGWRPTHGVIWYRTHKSMLPFGEPLWRLEQTLAFKPLGGDYSVGGLIAQLASKTTWQDLPMVGETQKYGNKLACDYCSVRDVCYTQSKGAPF